MLLWLQLLQQSMQREANVEVTSGNLSILTRLWSWNSHVIVKVTNTVWLSETIQGWLTIRSVVGRNGYDYLQNMGATHGGDREDMTPPPLLGLGT